MAGRKDLHIYTITLASRYILANVSINLGPPLTSYHLSILELWRFSVSQICQRKKATRTVTLNLFHLIAQKKLDMTI